MEIHFENFDRTGSFYIEEGGERLAEMAFTWIDEGDMRIDHTEVDPKLEGRGVGKQLVRQAVEMAREEKFKIVPLCPFARAILHKEKDYDDVLRA